MPSFSVETLGCKLNQLESEAITDAFLQAGFKPQKDSREIPCVVVVNTCTVTSKADQKARRVIRKILRDYPDSCVLVTGCYAQLNKDDLLKLDNGGRQRLFVINKENVINLINYIYDSTDIFTVAENFLVSDSYGISKFQFNPKRFSAHTRSFLKVQDGCNNHCTYCRIRLARGPSVSLEADEVLSRLRILEKNHSEVVLTGVNISQYCDNDKAINLARLLDYILSGTEKISLRLSSLSPECIDEDLSVILAHKRVRPHFHLSIQSGSKKILERMGRGYNSWIAEKAVSLLRGAKDDPFLACDLITGFPGETQAEFEETFALCEKIDFAWIHVFPYSRRPGTEAFSYTGTVHEAEITKRARIFTDLAKQGRKGYVQRWLNRETEVLVEANSKGIGCSGVSENYLKTLIRCNGAVPPPGTVLQCKLIDVCDTDDFDVIAAVQ